MVNFYPLWFKKRVLDDYYTKNYTKISELIKRYQISQGSLYNWIKFDRENKLLPKKEKYVRKTKITSEIRVYIKTYVIKRVHFKICLLIYQIKRNFKVIISRASIYRILKESSITNKKIRTNYVIKNKRKYLTDFKNFSKKIKGISTKEIISIDESHFDTRIDALKGWSTRGDKITVRKHIKRIHRFTLLLAISSKKIMLRWLLMGSVTKDIFEKFLRELSSKCSNKRTLLMDNARIHHAHDVKKTIKDLNFDVIYNVPYSPQYNPIEKVFSKIKSLLRAKKDNHLIDNLKNNIDKCIKKIKQKDLTNFYKDSFRCFH